MQTNLGQKISKAEPEKDKNDTSLPDVMSPIDDSRVLPNTTNEAGQSEQFKRTRDDGINEAEKEKQNKWSKSDSDGTDLNLMDQDGNKINIGELLLENSKVLNNIQTKMVELSEMSKNMEIRISSLEDDWK